MPETNTTTEKTIHQIKPHGGRLVNRIIEGDRKKELLDRAQSLPKLQLNARELADIEMLAVGVLPGESPLGLKRYVSKSLAPIRMMVAQPLVRSGAAYSMANQALDSTPPRDETGA